jgi:hypothetical protein
VILFCVLVSKSLDSCRSCNCVALLLLTVFLVLIALQRAPRTSKKIDRLAPIVGETEQVLNRRNSPLNSRAEISDGSAKRFFVVC